MRGPRPSCATSPCTHAGWHSAPTPCCSHSRRGLYEDSGAASELAWLPASELVWIPASLFDTRANNRSSNRSPSYCGTVNKLPETHYINPFLLTRNDLVYGHYAIPVLLLFVASCTHQTVHQGQQQPICGAKSEWRRNARALRDDGKTKCKAVLSCVHVRKLALSFFFSLLSSLFSLLSSLISLSL